MGAYPRNPPTLPATVARKSKVREEPSRPVEPMTAKTGVTKQIVCRERKHV